VPTIGIGAGVYAMVRFSSGRSTGLYDVAVGPVRKRDADIGEQIVGALSALTLRRAQRAVPRTPPHLFDANREREGSRLILSKAVCNAILSTIYALTWDSCGPTCAARRPEGTGHRAERCRRRGSWARLRFACAVSESVIVLGYRRDIFSVSLGSR